MQPKQMTLSNDLKHALQAVFLTLREDSSSTQVQRGALLWLEMLQHVPADVAYEPLPEAGRVVLSTKSIKALADFHQKNPAGSAVAQELASLQAALLDMQVGAGNPVIYVQNMPKNTGLSIFHGMMQAMGTNITERNQKESIPSLRFTDHLHQDAGEFTEKKTLRGLYCEQPGTPISPTIFASAEEILQAMEQDKKVVEQFGNLDALRAKAEQILVATEDTEPHPLLTNNPRWCEGAEAPPMILHLPDVENMTVSGTNCASEFLAAFKKAAESLRDKLSEEGIVNTKADSMVLWNDRFVLHDRGNDRGRKTIQGSRVVFSQFAVPDYVGSEQVEPVIGAATGVPCAHIQTPPRDAPQMPLSPAITNAGKAWQNHVRAAASAPAASPNSRGA